MLVEVVPCFIVLICFTAPPTMAIEDVTVASFSIGGVTSFLDAFQKTCATCSVACPSVDAFPKQRLGVGVGSKLQ